MRRAEQDRLLLQGDAFLAMLQHAPAHEVALLGLVQARAEDRPSCAVPRGPQGLLVTLRRELDGGVRRREDRRDRSVVLLQPDHGGAVEPGRELQDVLHGRGAEPVDRLRVVADHREVARRVRRSHPFQDVGLQRVRVLVLVDEHVIEHRRQRVARLGRGRQRFPEQQQVVVVQDVLIALADRVRLEDLPDAVDLVHAPRVVTLQHVGELLAGVHRPRVDRRERVLAREPSFPRGEPQLLAQQVHHVGTVGLVQHREVGTQAERATVEAEQPVGDRVERPTPHALGLALAGRTLRAREHLACGAPAERQQQDPLRAHTAFHQVSDATGEGGGLAGPGAGHDQQRSVAEQHGGALLRVEVVEHVFEAYISGCTRSTT